MRFAKLTYGIAGIWGILILPPMYFLYAEIGRKDPPAITHPEFFFGWIGVTLAWQVLFLILAKDPIRYRPMMIPAMLEKLAYVLAILVLFEMKMVNPKQAATAIPDSILFVFFVAAFVQTKARDVRWR